MRPSYYREQWQQLKDSDDSHAIGSLSQRVASSFIDRYYYSDEYNQEYVQLLCEMATHFGEPALNQLATGALFGTVIERLCDDFEELETETYNRLICQVTRFLCELPEGGDIKTGLESFGLDDAGKLFDRIESIRINPDRRIPGDLKPNKILVLSRITIGADVAITSVICQRLARHFPDAVISVIGNEKLRQVFAPDSGIRVHELHYPRRGDLLERFLVWLRLLREVRQEIAGLSTSEYLLLDPDSRLTQLGVLPLAPLENYRFFNSRGKQGYPAKAAVSELTNLWLDHILGEGEHCYPSIWIDSGVKRAATELRELIDPSHSATLITINFGVGGNARKMVPGGFERELVCELLNDAKVKIILDLGFGDEERQRSEAVLSAAREQGIVIQEVSFADLRKVNGDTQLLGVNCSIGAIAACIARSDEFIGYDSACQHIAAAEGIRTFTIFAGANNARFIRRWHAGGNNTSEIIHVDTISKHEKIVNGEIIARLQDLRQS